MDYMPDGQEVLRKHVQFFSGPDDVMVWLEDVGGMDGS